MRTVKHNTGTLDPLGLFAATRDEFHLRSFAAIPDGIVTYEKLDDGIVTQPSAPDFAFGPIVREFGHLYYGQRSCREVGLYRVRGGRVFSDGVVARKDSLMFCDELTIHKGVVRILVERFWCNLQPLQIRHERGRLAVIAGPAHDQYGHWLIDHMPKLFVLQKFGIDWEDLRLAIPTTLATYARAWLSMLGVNEEQLVVYDPRREAIEAEELLLPTQLRFESVASPLLRAASDMLLARLVATGQLPDQMSADLLPHKRIYISRSHDPEAKRQLKNREAVERMMADIGFEAVRPEALPIIEQVGLFRQARQIVGEYGTALHNSIFSPAGTIVAALRGSHPDPGFLQSGIGRVLGQPTGYVFGTLAAHDKSGEFSVEADDVSDCVRLILNPAWAKAHPGATANSPSTQPLPIPNPSPQIAAPSRTFAQFMAIGTTSSARQMLEAADLPVRPSPFDHTSISPEAVAQAFENDFKQLRTCMRDPDETVLFMLTDESAVTPDMDQQLTRIQTSARDASLLCILVRYTQSEPRGKADILSHTGKIIVVRIVVHSPLATAVGFGNETDTAHVVSLLKKVRRS